MHPSKATCERICVLLSSGRLIQAVGDAECGEDTEEQVMGYPCSSPSDWEQWRWDLQALWSSFLLIVPECSAQLHKEAVLGAWAEAPAFQAGVVCFAGP